MKSAQIIIRTFAFLGVVSLLLFSSCDPKEKETTKDCPCEEEQEVKEPEGIISGEQAADLFKTYTETRSPLIENYERETRGDTNFIPTRYTKFSYKVLRQYLAYIEQEAARAGVQVDTVRIYYGTYNMQREASPGHNTVFLVPSTDFDGKNRAFEIIEEDGRTRAKAIPMDFGTGLKGTVYQKEGESRQFASFGPSKAAPATLSGSLVLNDGTTAPPPYY